MRVGEEHPPHGSGDLVERSSVSSGQRFAFVDLFAGMGGFHRALAEGSGSPFNGACVLASEIDPACRDAYQLNFPGTTVVSDVVELARVPKTVPDHDVLCAGFPCQPFSKSGLQRGIEEVRGTLFYEILKILREKRPRFVVLENVRNLAGPRQHATFTTIIRKLRELGYRVSDQPTVFSPHLLSPDQGGRPQVRERVFILAEFVGAGAPDLHGPNLVPKVASPGWQPARWNLDAVLQTDVEVGHSDAYRLRPSEIRWIEAWNDFARRLHGAEGSIPGFPIWVDAFYQRPTPEERLALPGWKQTFLAKNEALYDRGQNASWIDRWVAKWAVDGSVFPTSRRKFEWQAGDLEPDLWKLFMQLRPSGLRAKRPTYLPALVAINQTSIIGPLRRRVTPREAARLQGFPDDHHLHPDDSIAYRQLGNAVHVGVVQHVARALFDASSVGWPGAPADGRRLVAS